MDESMYLINWHISMHSMHIRSQTFLNLIAHQLYIVVVHVVHPLPRQFSAVSATESMEIAVVRLACFASRPLSRWLILLSSPSLPLPLSTRRQALLCLSHALSHSLFLFLSLSPTLFDTLLFNLSTSPTLFLAHTHSLSLSLCLSLTPTPTPTPTLSISFSLSDNLYIFSHTHSLSNSLTLIHSLSL